MNEFDNKYNIVDEITPINSVLSAHYKRSFAFFTVKDRLPVILTNVVDQLNRDKDEIVGDNDEAREELKMIVGNVSKLKYELQTDKEFVSFIGNEPDKDHWNAFLDSLVENKSYFTSKWLYAECYMYRRLSSFFENSMHLSHFDYFRKQKCNALTTALNAISSVLQRINEFTETDPYSVFEKLMKLNLWSNRCDLSISSESVVKSDPFQELDALDPCILVNETTQIWNCIKSADSECRIFDIVQDNSGYEIFTDFILADYFISNRLASKIRFHIKEIPWFVSDVNLYDFNWTINVLKNYDKCKYVANFGAKIAKYIENEQFELCSNEHFWTGPYEFYEMSSKMSDLYKRLSEAYLIVFKGDLNYRKLLGDINCKFDSKFDDVLKGFKPSNLCTLRTVKADLICGIDIEVANSLSAKDPKWMETGEYGVIQFSAK